MPSIRSSHELDDPNMYDGLSKPRWRQSTGISEVFKFSMANSYKSTILIIELGRMFDTQVNQYIAQKKKASKKGALHFHPIMGVLLSQHNLPVNFIIYFNGKYIKTESFKDMLLLYLQIFHVFDYFYPSEAKLVCELMSYCLMDFELGNQPGWTAVKSFGDKFLETINVRN